MTSVDSGVETGNDSNDSSILFEFVQHDGQQQHAANQVVNNNVTAVANFSIDMDNIKWPIESVGPIGPVGPVKPELGLSWCRGLQLGNYNYENRGNSLEIPKLISDLVSNAVNPLPVACCHEVGDCNQLKWYGKLTSPVKFVKNRTLRVRKNHMINWLKLSLERRMRLAAATNNIMMMERLLRKGASPNCFDEQGRTPLHHAACRGYAEMVRMLLENGANPNQRDCIGNTPLHLAAVTSKISVVTLLLGAGTDVNLLDRYGYNPLQLAQTKLKLFQNYKNGGDMVKVKEEMRHVVDMLMVYFQKQEKNTQIEMEMLSNFCSRLSLSNTSDQVQSDVKDLLTNISALSITS